MKQRLVCAVLADEAERQRHARHRQRGGAGRYRCHRHRLAEPREDRNVAATSLMVDRASHQEERALVTGVCDQVHESRRDRLGVPTPRSIVKTPSALTVEYARMRLRSVSCTDRYAPRTIVTAPAPVTAVVHSGVAAKNRRHPRDEIHTGFDHRRRVQIGADGRRGGHRVRQPEMKWHLRGLGKCGEQDQDRDRGVERMRHDRGGLAAIADRLVVARHIEEQHAGGKQRETTAPVTINAWSAADRASSRSCSKPMSRKDVKPVSSQKTNSVRTLSLSATPSIAPMKAKSDA